MTTRVRLEPLSRAHLDGLASLVDDPAVQRFTRIPEPPPEKFAEQWLAVYETGRAERTREGFAIVDAPSGRFLGAAVVPAIDVEGRTMELGYAVAREARGRGVAAAALAQLTTWALDERGALRLVLLISVDNEASKRVAERCGYVREGTMRSVHVKQGRREDTELWSLLPGDPRSPSTD